MLIIDCYIAKHVHHVASRTATRVDSHEVKLIVLDLVLSLFVLGFSVFTLLYSLGLEAKATEIIQEIVGIPFVEPEIPFSTKIERFFVTIDSLQSDLWVDSQIGTVAFACMVLMLCRIVVATAVHPQLKVLFGSLQKAMNDLWHFALVMLVLYLFFSFTALWLFGDEREDFATFGMSFVAEFEMLMGRLPKDFMENNQLIVFVCFSILVQFFLMRHFIIAILMGGYQKNRKHVDENPVVNGFITDVVLTMRFWTAFYINKWPSRRRLAYLLRNKVSSRKVNYVHLRLQLPDIPSDKLRTVFDHYHAMPQIASSPPAWMTYQSRYLDTSYQYFMKQSLIDIWNVVVPTSRANAGDRKRHSLTMGGFSFKESRKGSQSKATNGSDAVGADSKRDERHLVVLTALAAPRAQRALQQVESLLGSSRAAAGEVRGELESVRRELAGLQEQLRGQTAEVCANHHLVGEHEQLLEVYEAMQHLRLAPNDLPAPEAAATYINLAEIRKVRAALQHGAVTNGRRDRPVPVDGEQTKPDDRQLTSPRIGTHSLPSPALLIPYSESPTSGHTLSTASLRSTVQLGKDVGFA